MFQIKEFLKVARAKKRFYESKIERIECLNTFVLFYIKFMWTLYSWPKITQTLNPPTKTCDGVTNVFYPSFSTQRLLCPALGDPNGERTKDLARRTNLHYALDCIQVTHILQLNPKSVVTWAWTLALSTFPLIGWRMVSFLAQVQAQFKLHLS